MVERLVGTVVRGEQADDVTLLVLRRLVRRRSAPAWEPGEPERPVPVKAR
jgi:hypothetical protein